MFCKSVITAAAHHSGSSTAEVPKYSTAEVREVDALLAGGRVSAIVREAFLRGVEGCQFQRKEN